MADKEKIRAEVERLITDLGEQRDVLLEELLDFIDSLPEEPHQELYDKLSKLRDDALSNETKESWESFLSEKPVSEDLEEEEESDDDYQGLENYEQDNEGRHSADTAADERGDAED